MAKSKEVFEGDRSKLNDIDDPVSQASQKSNGNNESLKESKPGGAQSGGPGIEKARDRQPPDATRTDK